MPRSIIGLDYGTHATKVVHRVRGDKRGEVQVFDEPCAGYTPSSSPSAIRNIDDRLFFGTTAVNLTEGIDYGSLKADLLDPPDDWALRQEVQILTAAYLGWVLQKLHESNPTIKENNVVVQYSAPTAHAGQDELRKLYEQIAHASYAAVTESRIDFSQGVSLQAVNDALLPILNKQVPPSSERKFFVMPETIAPIVSLQLEPLKEAGIYLIADMGASTTEISVCAVNDFQAGYSILAYADDTEVRGGIHLKEISEMQPQLRENRLTTFKEAAHKQVKRTWFVGFQKDMQNVHARARWKDLRILLSGGATHATEVDALFRRRGIAPLQMYFGDLAEPKVARHIPTTLNSKFEDEDLSLFAVANGLSIQRPLWPEFFHDHEIDTLDGAQQEEDGYAIPYYLQTD